MAAIKPGGDVVEQMRKAARGAARLMAADGGPRIAALAFDGWDTHVAEGGATGRLASLLGGLDDAFGEFETALGPAWARHGGRGDHRVRPHGARQRRQRLRSRHGFGGVPRRRRGGGRPRRSPIGRACKPADLYENRDLRPTTDLRAVLKGVLADHLGPVGGGARRRCFPWHARRFAHEGTDRGVNGDAFL